LTKSRGILAPRRFWTDAELDLLRSMYPECTGQDVAAWLDCTPSRVFQMAKKLGIEKSAEFLASDASGRVRRGKQHPSMTASQFQKGLTPWNKGRDSTETGTGHHPNSRRTQFRKGRKAEEARNYVSIGSLRVCADGYLERKMTDDPATAPARRWVAVHRLVWEATHGPIPAGHIVCFLPGKKTTVPEEVAADRLECITRAENARRNHPRNRSPELAKLVQLKGAITRQVNRIAREAQEQRA
jgi:hypothetical protein